MTISRGQMPRQLYGLGSLVKSITKPFKKVFKSVKKNPFLALAALNFAPMLGGGSPFIGFGKGKFASDLFNISGGGLKDIFAKKAGEKTIGGSLKAFAGGSLLGSVLGSLEEQGSQGISRNIPALRTKLTEAYRNQRTFADAEDEEAAIANQVEIDLSEYTQDMNRGIFAMGGRAKYAMGTSEQNAIEASGIMGLPLNQNPAGVTELDLRETGGFIPPVGVKEKADDIPAMLSNNEFVFTADAVRGMGDGNVNKGAQRLYDQMKMLEKGGKV
tara:strand:+ start:234 stop:1049 length:816 start_codon:yes stop_codon:yes gene_type:complete